MGFHTLSCPRGYKTEHGISTAHKSYNAEVGCFLLSNSKMLYLLCL